MNILSTTSDQPLYLDKNNMEHNLNLLASIDKKDCIAILKDPPNHYLSPISVCNFSLFGGIVLPMVSSLSLPYVISVIIVASTTWGIIESCLKMTGERAKRANYIIELKETCDKTASHLLDRFKQAKDSDNQIEIERYTQIARKIIKNSGNIFLKTVDNQALNLGIDVINCLYSKVNNIARNVDLGFEKPMGDWQLIIRRLI